MFLRTQYVRSGPKEQGKVRHLSGLSARVCDPIVIPMGRWKARHLSQAGTRDPSGLETLRALRLGAVEPHLDSAQAVPGLDTRVTTKPTT